MNIFRQPIKNISDFKGLRIKLASPEEILAWSYGEVTKPETINYRTLKPEKDGLFDERIFGPTKDWECYCGKYKRVRYRGIICDKCGVEVTYSRVRRERMGHITLATPVAHIWFFKGSLAKLPFLLNMSGKDVESVIYFSSYVVISVNDKGKRGALNDLDKALEKKKITVVEKFKNKISELKKEYSEKQKQVKKRNFAGEALELALNELDLKYKHKKARLKKQEKQEIERAEEIIKRLIKIVKGLQARTVLSEDEYFSLGEYTKLDFFEVGIGADALLEVIKQIDLDKLIEYLRKQIKSAKGQRQIKLIKRLRIVEGFKSAGIDPSWMILRVLPVIPPDLRPMVQLSGGRFATSDLNDLYRRVINRNNRLKHLIDLGAPEIILRNEKRMLQESVDALIYKTQRKRRYGQKLKSLSDMLKGKQGRFRQNLLGKRVDYSGRSVIVVGPELKLNQCGIPKVMALEMFKPFILRELVIRGICPNVKRAKSYLEEMPAEVFDILEEVTKNHPLLLNRAPTLHKLGIQAFYPSLIEGQAIRIPACVCSGYNADFDGDQMAVHIPLSEAAKKEARETMTPVSNLLKPADGSPVSVPNKEMVVGCFYLTSIDSSLDKKDEKKLKYFANSQEAVIAFDNGTIKLREPILLRLNKAKRVKTTVGRIILNRILPENLRFYNKPVDQSALRYFVNETFSLYDNKRTAKLINDFKDLGFWGSIRSGGLSVSVFDNRIVEQKDEIVRKAEEQTAKIDEEYNEGIITDSERRSLSNEVWIDSTEKLVDLTWAQMTKENPIRMIIESGGARASREQLKQLAAIRGLVVDPLGKIVELPTKSNFREGLEIFEYVNSARGSRKGLTDSALKTADAGYLTRRLVDVAHDVVVREEDCGSGEGFELVDLKERRTDFAERIKGRFLSEPLLDPETKKILYNEGDYIGEKDARKIVKKGVKKVTVRSPLSCKTRYGICTVCYGMDFSTLKPVEIGTPVGVIAAQSIGEPGTQLTMRVKHTGGIVGLDVTQGLPRVEELFEARTPKILSPIAEIAGKVSIKEDEGYTIRIESAGRKEKEIREYSVPKVSKLLVEEGQLVEKGTQLASGFLDIQEVMDIRGLRGAQDYLLAEIQKVYESQGISINDKHFEVIIRRMSDKIKIDAGGDTSFTIGDIIDIDSFEEENAEVMAQGGKPASGQITLLGITKSALHTPSWLSAASFQRTTQVLTDAATQGNIDYLRGLKENVIIGRLIPTSPKRARLD